MEKFMDSLGMTEQYVTVIYGITEWVKSAQRWYGHERKVLKEP